MASELRKWRSGERSNDPAGVMQSVAGALSDTEVDALASFLAQGAVSETSGSSPDR